MSETLAVALVTGVLAAVPATITAMAAYKKSSATHTEIQGNGLGTHTEMLENLVRGQGRNEGRLDELNRRFERHELDQLVHRVRSED